LKEPLKRGTGIVTGYGLKAGVRFPAGIRDFCPLHSVQIGFGAHPASRPVGNGGCFPESKADVKLTTHLHLVPRSRLVELYLHFLMRLYGMVLN
jgi:hypothetical protein